jgi:hypothetical protein
MLVRLFAGLLGGVLLCSCTDSPVAATAPTTPLRLGVTVTPNPLAAPAEPGDVVWDVQLRASGSGTILIQRGVVLLLDAAGVRVGETQQFWSRSAGCSVCSTDVTIAAGASARWSGNRVRYVGGGTPVKFVYTIFYADDLGPGSITVEVPVR